MCVISLYLRFNGLVCNNTNNFLILLLGNHTEVVKILLLNGASLEAETCSTVRPMDVTHYFSGAWNVMRDVQKGIMPEVIEVQDLPEVPECALLSCAGKTGKKKDKKGKKGKKSGKKGGKKGKKGKKKKK